MDPKTRQEFVSAAVVFLQNPKLDSPLKEKLKFLKDKGLSDIEVDEALNQAIVKRTNSAGGSWNFLLIMGLCFAGFKLYQSYLDSCRGNKVESTKVEVKTEPSLSEILQKINELKRLMDVNGVEIHSLKTLLLGPEKFAAPPVIPAWQLEDGATNQVNQATQQDIKK